MSHDDLVALGPFKGIPIARYGPPYSSSFRAPNRKVAFFTRNVQMLARELDCGFVIAVHDHYLGLPGYQAAQPLLTTEIRIPRLTPADEPIRRIIARRVELAGVSIETSALFTEDAVRQLAQLYGGAQNLRRVLATIDRAVQHACSDGVAPVSLELIRTAVADLT